MKTLKITEKTHKELTKLKASQSYKTLDATINWLIEYFYYTPLKGEYHFDDK